MTKFLHELPDASYWIKKLKLIKHPTAGYYAETYRSSLNVTLKMKLFVALIHQYITCLKAMKLGVGVI